MAQGQSDSVRFILIHVKYYTLEKKRKSSSRSCPQPRGSERPGVSYLPALFLLLHARARQQLRGSSPSAWCPAERPTERKRRWPTAGDRFHGALWQSVCSQCSTIKGKAHFTNESVWVLALGRSVSWGNPTAASPYREAYSDVPWIPCEYRRRFLCTLRSGTEYSAHFKLRGYLNALGTKDLTVILISTVTCVPEVIQKKQGGGLGRGCCQLMNASQSQVEIQISFKVREGITPASGEL